MNILLPVLQCPCNPRFKYISPVTYGKHFESNRHKAYVYTDCLRAYQRLNIKCDNVIRERDAARSSVNILTNERNNLLTDKTNQLSTINELNQKCDQLTTELVDVTNKLQQVRSILNVLN
jgi:hypothetical protein